MLETRRTIRRSGFVVVRVPPGPDGEPGFHDTAGLTAAGQPELVVYDVPEEMGHWLLSDLAERVLEGEALADGDRVPRLVQGSCAPRLWTVTRFQDPLGVAFKLYGEDRVTARQLVVPDREDRLPWEPGYDGPEGQRTLFDPPPADGGTL